jgi:hypothetical protein
MLTNFRSAGDAMISSGDLPEAIVQLATTRLLFGCGAVAAPFLCAREGSGNDAVVILPGRHDDVAVDVGDR